MIIYKITNSINEMVYVGQTKNLKKRIKGHRDSFLRENHISNDYPLYKDMKLLGFDKFKFEIIEEIESNANEAEERWIKYYKDLGISYNQTSYSKIWEDPDILKRGAEVLIKSNLGRRKKVEQYDLKGNLLATYEGVREAARITGVSHHTIQKCANKDAHRKTGGGYVWKYPQ